MKRPIAIALMVVIALTLKINADVPLDKADEHWEGTAEGIVLIGADTLRPFANWSGSVKWDEYGPNRDWIGGNWYDQYGHTGLFHGKRDRESGRIIEGTWTCDQYPALQGEWEGIWPYPNRCGSYPTTKVRNGRWRIVVGPPGEGPMNGKGCRYHD